MATVRRIRGDADDVFSGGFVCPKGTTLGHLHEDPDRLRTPLARTGTDDEGAPVFEEITWDEAFRRIADGLGAVLEAGDRNALGAVLGQSQRPHAGGEHLQPSADPGGRHAEPVLGQHRRPDAQARVGRPHVRQPRHHPGARPRPHRLPAHAGRQPVGLQRQPLHGTRLPRADRSAAAAGRAARGGRSTAQPDRQGGRRAPPDPPRRRCGMAVLASARPVRATTW